MDVKIGRDCYIPKEQIRLYCQAGSVTAKKHIEYAERIGKPVFRILPSQKAAASIIVTVDFSIYITDISIQTLSDRMNKN